MKAKSGNRAAWIDLVLSEDGPKGSSTRLVGVALANHAKPDGTGAYPSERRLESMTNLNRRTVREALRRLVGSRFSEKRPMGKGQYGKTVFEYLLTFPETVSGPPHSSNADVPVQDQWSSDGAADGAPIGASNGADIGSPSAPEPITRNSKLKTQERAPTRPEDPAKEVLRGKTIAELDLGADAIAICQEARPGADPLEVIRKFRERLGSGSALSWQKALRTFASMERIIDDEQRAAERGRHNGAGPRKPAETSEEYLRRSQDPPISPEMRDTIHRAIPRS